MEANTETEPCTVRLPSVTKSKHIKLLQHLRFLSVSIFFLLQTETHTESKPHTLHAKHLTGTTKHPHVRLHEQYASVSHVFVLFFAFTGSHF